MTHPYIAPKPEGYTDGVTEVTAFRSGDGILFETREEADDWETRRKVPGATRWIQNRTTAEQLRRQKLKRIAAFEKAWPKLVETANSLGFKISREDASRGVIVRVWHPMSPKSFLLDWYVGRGSLKAARQLSKFPAYNAEVDLDGFVQTLRFLRDAVNDPVIATDE